MDNSKISLSATLKLCSLDLVTCSMYVSLVIIYVRQRERESEKREREMRTEKGKKES